MNQTATVQTPHYKKLKRGNFNVLVPSIAEGMMAGAVAAKQDKKGTIWLIYSDGSMESRPCKKDLITEFGDNFFSVVSFVQAARAALEAT